MRQRGLTLAEVVVSTSIFLALSLLVVVIMRIGQRSEVKGDVHSQADRAVLIGMAKIRAEVQGGVVTGALSAFEGSPGELRYFYIDSSDPDEVDFTGHPIYQGPARITRTGTQLVRLEGPAGNEDVRILTELGSEGEVSFQLLNNRMLKVDLSATRPDRTDNEKLVRYAQEMKLYLHNQP